jgi:microcystin-dependent protein
MAWTTPRTWVAGELVTASLMNTHVRDNLSVLRDSMWPIGSVYTSVTNTNPATTLGVGTWSAFGAGRTLVGVDTGQTEFDTVEETGGAKTHTLSASEMPVHNHGVTDPGHTHEAYITDWDSSQTATGGPEAGNFRQSGTKTTQSATTGISTNNAGSGGSHNNLQPYITVYFWKRTA